jgi:hypothetical protein
MAERVLGPTGSKRRKRFLLVPILLIACTALFLVAGGAQAVHDEGIFQLDGNGLNTANSTPAMPAATEDADNICAANLKTASNPTGCVKTAVNTASGTTATKSAFVTDAFASATDNIYTTGGSKDDLDISAWKFKTAQPSPDKADIEHGFLGLYTAPNGDRLAYFGGDRFSNGGDENTAFWLFQSPVGLAGDGTSGSPPVPDPSICATNSGCSFTGVHTAAVPGADNCLTPVGKTAGINITATKPSNVACTESDNGAGQPSTDKQGDILIVSAFTTGGTVPTISVYEWVGDHAINAKSGLCVTADCSVFTKLNANPGCDANPAVTGDFACAITDQASLYNSCPTGTPRPPCLPGNTIPVPAPWTYTEKGSDNSSTGASVTPDKWLDGVYLEGGLNLTALGLQSECTASFLMNTRSSQSVDASLQDFALGQVGSCTSGTTTKPKYLSDPNTTPPTYSDVPALGLDIPTQASGNPPIDVRDHADISVAGGAQTFGGTVSFFLCGPLALNTTSNCESGGVQIGSAVTVNGLNAAASVDSADATLTSVGRYCWRAVYSGDSSHSVPGSRDPVAGDTTSLTECFKVNPVRPTLSTQATCSPLTGTDCVLGAVLSDTATLGGTAYAPGTNGIGPGGTINATDTTNKAGGTITWNAYGPNSCNTLAAGPFTATVSGDDTYPTTTPNPVHFTPTAVGDYVFVATYGGNSPNTLAPLVTATCASPGSNETITVIGTASSSSDQRWLPNDRITLSSTTGSILKGSLTVTLYRGTFTVTDGVCSADATATAIVGQSYAIAVDQTNANPTNSFTYNTTNSTFFVGTGPAQIPVGTDVTYGDAGAYFWLIHYDDSNLTDPKDRCESSNVTITN